MILQLNQRNQAVSCARVAAQVLIYMFVTEDYPLD